MSIGDTLANARREAGLTVTQVSQQTQIRESIVRSIEQGDFSPCGGDFYARGHIRSIAEVVGVDPVPLIREYDEEHGAPGGMRAAQIFEPATPVKIREPRNLHLGRYLAVALLAAIEYSTALIFHSWLYFPFALVAGCLLSLFCWVILKKLRAVTFLWRASPTPLNRTDEYIPDDDKGADTTRANVIRAGDRDGDESTVSVTIYLSEEWIHGQVEAAVDELLAAAGLVIEDREEPVTGSWFRRMRAGAREVTRSPVAYEAALTTAHAADQRLVLGEDADITATLLQNLGPVIGALQPTKDAVLRVGALLIVKVDWVVNVFQLTAAQQVLLNHRPQLASSPHEIIACLNLTASPENGDATAIQDDRDGSTYD